MFWLWRHTGVLNAWRLTERGGWNSSPSLSYPFRIIWTFARNPVSPTITGQILLFGTLVAIVGAVLAIRQRQPAPVLIYGLAAGVLGAISSPVGLRPRFVMLAFPLVVAYGTRLRGRAYVATLVVSAASAGGHDRARVHLVGRVPLTGEHSASLSAGTNQPTGCGVSRA